MSGRKLTIGMAAYDDYDGIYFTVQALMLYHSEVYDNIELLVIDNKPNDEMASYTKGYVEDLPIPGRYIECPEIDGMAVKGQVYEKSDTLFTMCIDSHVMVYPGAIKKLLNYFSNNIDTKDIFHGPVINNNHKSIKTYMNRVWGVGVDVGDSLRNYGQHMDDDPFIIPAAGMALSACRTEMWPGYNKNLEGYFVEEHHIHEKFRRNGGDVVMLPFLRYTHRTKKEGGVTYRDVWRDRIINSIHIHKELDRDLDEVRKYYCKQVGCYFMKKAFEEYDRIWGLDER